MNPAGRLDCLYKNVYWLGGSPCGGKSSAAEVLAERYGLSVYSCDAAFERHAGQADERAPTLTMLRAANLGELFMRPPPELARIALAASIELFEFVTRDLSALGNGPVLAEGATLLPHLVARRAAPGRAAFITPSVAFQRRLYAARPWARQVVGAAPDPALAFDHWMRRDELFARWVRRAARAERQPALVVDGSAPLEATICWLEETWGLKVP